MIFIYFFFLGFLCFGNVVGFCLIGLLLVCEVRFGVGHSSMLESLVWLLVLLIII